MSDSLETENKPITCDAAIDSSGTRCAKPAIAAVLELSCECQPFAALCLFHAERQNEFPVVPFENILRAADRIRESGWKKLRGRIAMRLLQ